MQAVIMAGGKGTRLKDLTVEIPKPMIPIDGKPVLEYQIENLKNNKVDEIILIVGYLGDKIVEYFGDGSEFGVNISYYYEKEPLGTGGAFYYIKNRLRSDFILLYGDAFLDIDFNRMYDYHKKNQNDVTLFAHPNSHPYDSDIIIDANGTVSGWDYSNHTIRDYDYINLVSAGVFVFNSKSLDALDGTKKDLEKDIISEIVKCGKVGAYRSTEYVKDMGSPDRLERVSSDYKKGIIEKKNLQNKQKCIFLDRDGTIMVEDGFIKKREQVKLLPDATEAIGLINNTEYLAVVITNQPVLARGDCTYEEFEAINKRFETLLGNDGVYIDDTFFCPHHPDKGFVGEVPELKIDCSCRKPKSGMFLDAAEKYNIDLAQSYIIGDSTIDIEAGRRLGLKTILVKTGVSGGDKKYDVIPDYVSDTLLSSVKLIIEGDNK